MEISLTRLIKINLQLSFAVWLAIGPGCSRHERRREHKTSSKTQERAKVIAERQELIRAFPLIGTVTGLHLTIHEKPDPSAPLLGWLRLGSHILLQEKSQRTPTCRSGWHPLYPRGYACSGSGIKSSLPIIESDKDWPAHPKELLPYRYFFIKDHPTAAYKHPPDRKEQDKVFLVLRRYRELRHAHPTQPQKDKEIAQAFLRGELKDEIRIPHYVAGFLERGFYVATLEATTVKDRVFVRTLHNTYLWLENLEPRYAPNFDGVDLGSGEHHLPLGWLVRAARPMKKITKSDGTIKFRDIEGADILARHMVLDDVQREEIEAPWRRWVYRLKDGAYVHPWFVSYAEPIKKPLGIKNDEPWIHINRKQQTLVLYVGKKPVFATLVSTGIEGHETPLGEFRLRSKRVTATMSDIGEDAVDDRYRIEDVPWTQYFSGSLAIHGTFWHDRFGLQRSHGCVNVSPGDARKLFFSTWPEVPLGWHGISARDENIKTSLVLITD